ncbi:MAG: hypothetical protein HY746_06250 [Elusimicrobia bacterium]|nr:hypothetical protein [Elusimicrobiota bacterium]
MKRIIVFIFSALICAGQAVLYAESEALSALQNAAPVDSLNMLQVQKPVELPSGLTEETKDAANSPSPLSYFPMEKKMRYEYEYTSSEFLGTKRVVVEFVEYSEKDYTTTVKVTVIRGSKIQSGTFFIQLTEKGLHSSDSILAGKRTEIPFPLYRGKTWEEGSNTYRITSLNAKTAVPAGSFENCLKITAKIGDGDAGTASRYYASGTGLVYEEILGEDVQEKIQLVSYQIMN